MKHILRASTNWSTFRVEMTRLSSKRQGDCFELLAKHYLQLAPRYTTKLRHVWLLKEVPPILRRHLNLPQQDEGIDLVAETKEGEYWAIQCKYRLAETGSLSRRELSTFTDLAFGVCKHFSLGLVCTTTDRFSRKLRLHGERLEFCAGDVWRALGSDFFRQLHQRLAGKPIHIKRKHPRPHQRRAIRNAIKHFAENGNTRGKLISPCATGKSLTAYWIGEALKARTALVAVPSLALIKQSLDVWATEAVANGRQFNWICVCSDEGVARTERDDAVVLVQDLGVRVHTDPAEIARWLRASKQGTSVVFTTYQSGKSIAKAARATRTQFDLGILDEAHNTAGKKGNLFSHLLHEKNIRIRKRVFMTATERRYAGQSDNIISMDDPEIYGETFEMLSFKEALESQPPILSDYQIVTIAVTREEVAELIAKNLFVRPDKGRWSDDVEAEMLAAAIALRKAIQRRPIKHAVSFHGSIARARAFQATQDAIGEAFSQYRPLETFHVSGMMPTAVRSRTMEEFETSKRALVTNARCLTEGVDVPNIDCILLADPRRSTVDIVQAVGRALRTASGKKQGYVVIPVLVEQADGNGATVQGTDFDAVLMVLRALAANDERIVEYFRTLATGRKGSPSCTPFDMVIPDGLLIDTNKFVSSVRLSFWSRLARLSWRPFEEARTFVRQLRFQNERQWREYCRGELSDREPRPNDIPACPAYVYRNHGWIGLGDWLGTGTTAAQLRQYRPFKRARTFVHRLGLRNREEWDKYCRGKLPDYKPKPDDIPAAPSGTYKDKGWAGWGDWLGTGTIAPWLRQYRPFRKARILVRRLGLRNGTEWTKYCKGELPDYKPKPDDIPGAPGTTYKDKGWAGWGDWLGTGTVATRFRQYRAFEKARAFVRLLGLRSSAEWRQYCKGTLAAYSPKPDDIPTNPNNLYKGHGWAGMGNWLGTDAVAPSLQQYWPFRRARAFVRELGLKNGKEWRNYCKGLLPGHKPKPNGVPANPQSTYERKGWIGIGDWLGTGTVAARFRVYRPFKKARACVRRLGLRNQEEWRKYCKGELSGYKPKLNDIPAAASQVYKDQGWTSWGDWFGTGTVAKQHLPFRSFQEVRRFARRLGLRSGKEWATYCRNGVPGKPPLPTYIPKSPRDVYLKKGWKGWGDWLGTGTVAVTRKEFRQFREARRFVRQLGLQSKKEWGRYCKGELLQYKPKPDDIPANASSTYKNKGWAGWGDWLGTGTMASFLKQFKPFREARAFVRSLGLKNLGEWRKYCKGQLRGNGKRPEDIPANPGTVYENQGWVNLGDWLGTGTIAPRFRQYRSFKDARAFVRRLHLRSYAEWRQYCKGQFRDKCRKPDDIPGSPYAFYQHAGWTSWPDWLGTE